MYDNVALTVGKDQFSFVFDNRDGIDTVADDVAKRGLVYYEIPMPTVLASIVRAGSGAFIDVGANTGIYSLLAAAARDTVHVAAFEPVSSIRDRLNHNLLINPALASRITVEPLALSSKAGTFIMQEHVNDQGLIATSSTLEVVQNEVSSNYRAIPVELTTFDSWVTGHSNLQIDLLKIDVEGHERDFFQGARATLRDHRPFLIVELLGDADFNYFANFLRDDNYADVALFPGRAEYQHRPRFISEAWNHLFCPQERLRELATLCKLIGLPLA